MFTDYKTVKIISALKYGTEKNLEIQRLTYGKMCPQGPCMCHTFYAPYVKKKNCANGAVWNKHCNTLSVGNVIIVIVLRLINIKY